MTDLLTVAAPIIRENEGVRSKPYEDTVGVLTIGIGRNLEKGLSADEIEYLFRNDLEEALSEAERFKYFSGLNIARQFAILDMSFQLGFARLNGFKKMHAAMTAGDYYAAADECLDSKYARQVPRRAAKVAQCIRTGRMP